MGPRLRDEARALAEALARSNEARDAPGTLRTLEVDDDGTFVTLGLRIDDATSISVVLMFEVRSNAEARAPSPPTRPNARSRHSWHDERSGIGVRARPDRPTRASRRRIADEGALLRARVDSPRASSPHRPRAILVATAIAHLLERLSRLPREKRKRSARQTGGARRILKSSFFDPPRSILTRLPPPNPQDGYPRGDVVASCDVPPGTSRAVQDAALAFTEDLGRRGGRD